MFSNKSSLNSMPNPLKWLPVISSCRCSATWVHIEKYVFMLELKIATGLAAILWGGQPCCWAWLITPRSWQDLDLWEVFGNIVKRCDSIWKLWCVLFYICISLCICSPEEQLGHWLPSGNQEAPPWMAMVSHTEVHGHRAAVHCSSIRNKNLTFQVFEDETWLEQVV